MNKLLIIDPNYKDYAELAKKHYPTCQITASDNVAAILNQASDIDIWLGAPNLCADLLKQSTKSPRWIQSVFAGIQPLLIDTLPKDYVLSRAVGVFDQLMAEYVLTYMLTHERTVIEHHQAQAKQQWLCGKPATLQNKTVLIVGAGTIGVGVAKLLKPFSINLLGIANTAKVKEPFDEIGTLANLAVYVAKADYVVNLLPDTPETHNIYDATIFSKMKEGAVFINAGRGVSVVDNDLIEALANNRPCLAVLDVFRTEPLPVDHPFWKIPNAILTGHSAALGMPVLIFDLFRRNLVSFEKQEPLLGQVNFKQGY